MLYESLALPVPSSGDNSVASTALLVYGASSAVGLYAVQIAKALGATVWATASGKNEELVKKNGADVVSNPLTHSRHRIDHSDAVR